MKRGEKRNRARTESAGVRARHKAIHEKATVLKQLGLRPLFSTACVPGCAVMNFHFELDLVLHVT